MVDMPFSPIGLTSMTQLHVYPTGVTHIVRPEDFPVMPVEHVGFTLKPFGFFSGNPAVDLPYAANAASKLVCCNGTTINGVHSNGLANGNGHADGHANGNGYH